MDIDSIVKAMKWPMIIGLTVLGTTVLLVAIFENLGLADSTFNFGGNQCFCHVHVHVSTTIDAPLKQGS
jgi:hypothetical protein